MVQWFCRLTCLLLPLILFPLVGKSTANQSAQCVIEAEWASMSLTGPQGRQAIFNHQPVRVSLHNLTKDGFWVDVIGNVRFSGRARTPLWAVRPGTTADGTAWLHGAMFFVRAVRHVKDDLWSLDVTLPDVQIDGVLLSCGDLRVARPKKKTLGTNGTWHAEASSYSYRNETPLELVRRQFRVHAAPEMSSPSIMVRWGGSSRVYGNGEAAGFHRVVLGATCGSLSSYKSYGQSGGVVREMGMINSGTILGWVSKTDLIKLPPPPPPPMPIADMGTHPAGKESELGIGGGGGGGTGENCWEWTVGENSLDFEPRFLYRVQAGTVIRTQQNGPIWATLSSASEYWIKPSEGSSFSSLGGNDVVLHGPLWLHPLPMRTTPKPTAPSAPDRPERCATTTEIFKHGDTFKHVKGPSHSIAIVRIEPVELSADLSGWFNSRLPYLQSCVQWPADEIAEGPTTTGVAANLLFAPTGKVSTVVLAPRLPLVNTDCVGSVLKDSPPLRSKLVPSLFRATVLLQFTTTCQTVSYTRVED